MKNLYTKANENATACMMSGDYRLARIWLDVCSAVISAMESGEKEDSKRVKYLMVYAENLENGIVL